jgi:hypothetical protein
VFSIAYDTTVNYNDIPYEFEYDYGLSLSLPPRPLEAVLSVPGMDRLRSIPGMQAVFARPLAVDCVGAVAAAAALGLIKPHTATGTGTGTGSDEKEKEKGHGVGFEGQSAGSVGNILSVDDIVREFRYGTRNPCRYISRQKQCSL